jgi:hypothetical protein
MLALACRSSWRAPSWVGSCTSTARRERADGVARRRSRPAVGDRRCPRSSSASRARAGVCARARRAVRAGARRARGRPVVMATCGIGKVNAAALTQALARRRRGARDRDGRRRRRRSRAARRRHRRERDAVQHDVDVTGARLRAGRGAGRAARVGRPTRRCATRAFAAAREVAARDGVRAVVGRDRLGRRVRRRPRAGGALRARSGRAAPRWRAPRSRRCAPAGGAVGGGAERVRHRRPRRRGRLPSLHAVAAERAVAVVRGTLRPLAACAAGRSSARPRCPSR